MMYRNSFRLLFSNFNLVWKLLVYKLITISISVGILVPLFNPIFTALSNNGFFENLSKFFTEGIFKFDFLASTAFLDNVAQIGLNVTEYLLAANLFEIIMIFVVILIIMPFINGLFELPTCEVLYGSMTSNAKFSFLRCFISNLWESIKLSATKLIIIVPYNVLCCAIAYGIIAAFSSSIGLIIALAPMIIVLICGLLYSLKFTLISGIAPSMINNGFGPIKAFKYSINGLKRRFLENYGTVLAMVITNIVLTTIVGIFSFMIGLVIVIPAFMLVFCNLQMVMHFHNFGNYYYLDSDVIYKSKRVSEQPTLKQLKNLI